LEMAVHERLFDGHAYGRPVLGTRDELLATDGEALRAFHRRFYRPDNAVLVVAGDLGDDALDTVERTLGSLPPGAAPRRAPGPGGRPAGVAGARGAPQGRGGAPAHRPPRARRLASRPSGPAPGVDAAGRRAHEPPPARPGRGRAALRLGRGGPLRGTGRQPDE